jgi:hypothetical protein
MTKTLSLIAVLLTTSSIAVTCYLSAIFFVLAVAPDAVRREPHGVQWIGFLAWIIVPAAALAWWLFKKMQQTYSRRIARAAAFAFGAITPVSLGVAFAVSPLAGGFIGAMVATFAVAVLLTVAVCLFAIRIVRWEEEAQENSTQAQP